MKKSDIPESQFTRAAEFAVEASRQLRESGEGRWWDDDYTNWLNDLLFSGRFWRRVARINSVEDAQRELLDIAASVQRRGREGLEDSRVMKHRDSVGYVTKRRRQSAVLHVG